MRFKKSIATLLSLIILFSAFAALPVDISHAQTATETEKAVFIGKAGSGSAYKRNADVMLPLNFRSVGSTTFNGETYFKLTFKCKMLSGSKPIIGVLHTGTGGTDLTYSKPEYCDLSKVTVSGGICTAIFKGNITNSYKTNRSYTVTSSAGSSYSFTRTSGERWGYITIGNAQFNDTSSIADYDNSFIMSEPVIQYCNSSGYVLNQTNLCTSLDDENIDFKGTYYFRKNTCEEWDCPAYATAGKWHVLGGSDLVRHITVPADYNTSANYSAADFTCVNKTALTREYYTNPAYPDLIFEKMKNSDNSGYSIISDIAKKAVIVEANHQGEAESSSPSLNRAGNLFIPFSVDQFFISGGGYCVEDSVFVKVTCNAKRLEGTGAPVIGRIHGYGMSGNWKGLNSQGHPASAINVQTHGYATTSDIGLPASTYNAETGEYVGWIRMRKNDSEYRTQYGITEVLTLGNAEHVAEKNRVDSSSFNSSFAFSDIKVDIYECKEITTTGPRNWTVGELYYEDVAPGFYDETLDTTTTYAYRCGLGYTSNMSMHAKDVITGDQNKWQVEGQTALIHSINLTECLAGNHNLTHYDSTDTTRNYYSCPSCNKYFSDAYGENEITDITAKRQMIYISSTGNQKSACAVIPLALKGFSGTKWFKFTCKMAVFGDEIPTVSNFRARYWGGTGAHVSVPEEDDMCVTEYSYDPENEVMTALIKMWAPSLDEMSRMPYHYTDAISGANFALIVGNGIYRGAGFVPSSSNASFAFCEPELYEYNEQSGSTSGENLITDISDKTVNLSTKVTLENFSSSSSDFVSDKTPMSAPLNCWYAMGTGSDCVEIRNIDTNYFEVHTWQYHPLVVPTTESIGYRAYYTCDCQLHSGRYFVDKGVTELSSQEIEITGMGSKKMVVLSSTGKTANVFMPIVFKSTGGVSLIGDKLYKLTFKAKLFGDNLPIVSLVRLTENGAVSEPLYVYNGGAGNGETPGGGAAFGNNLGVSYDAGSMTYSVFIRMNIPADAAGAHHAILIGNCEHSGNSEAEYNYQSSFAIADVRLYAFNTSSADIYGKNLINDFAEYSITDNTYTHPDDNYSSEDGIVSAPASLWSFEGEKSAFAVCDIPENYFSDQSSSLGTPKMLRISGYLSGSAVGAISANACLAPGETYQVDVDYRAFGGGDARIYGAYYTASSRVSVTHSYTSADAAGSHRSFRFKMPSGARVKGYNSNFALYLGMPSGSKNSQSVYFSNITVRKVSGSSLGSNVLPNGDFALSHTGKFTSGNTSDILCFDNADGLLTYSSADLLDLPDNDFFSGNDVPDAGEYAIKVAGGVGFYVTQLQFKVELEPSATYRLTYDYRCVGDIVSVITSGKGSATVNKISDYSNGRNTATYEIITGSDKTSYSDTEPNTRIYFDFDANSSDKEFYITNVKLFKLSGSSPVGNNLIGDLNPIYNSALYDEALPETLPAGNSSVGVILDQSGDTSMSSLYAHGWYMYNNTNTYNSVNASLVRVPDNFFQYLSFSQRLALLGDTIIGKTASDGISPYFNPNNDTVWADVKDLVHTKIEATFVAGNADGGASSIAKKRIKEIMSAEDIETTGTVYYVSSTLGSDNNDGKTENAPFKTPEKAMNVSKSGDTILFRRSDIWRNTSDSTDNVVNFVSNRVYGAYGEGEKPLFAGSKQNYGGTLNAGLWENTGGSVWRIKYSSSPTDGATAGMVYAFDNVTGEEIPCKNIAKPNTSNNNYSYSLSDVDSDLEFYAPDYSDSDGGYLYLYSSTNPANRFGHIEIALKREVISFENDVKIDNIAVKYGGGHGMNGNSKNRVYITNCEVGFIGGARHSGNRYGNGIQLGQLGDGFEVINSYIHDCFDAGVTYQSWSGNGEFKNIKFNDNVIERCHYNIEIFATYTTSVMRNIEINNNILRNAGYGWGSARRCDEYYRCADICFSKNKYYSNITNMSIKDNILDCTKSSLVMWTWSSSPQMAEGITMSGNVYIQRRGAVQDRVMAYGPIGGSYKYASSLKGLKEAVATFDTNPSSVIWLDSIS